MLGSPAESPRCSTPVGRQRSGGCSKRGSRSIRRHSRQSATGKWRSGFRGARSDGRRKRQSWRPPVSSPNVNGPGSRGRVASSGCPRRKLWRRPSLAWMGTRQGDGEKRMNKAPINVQDSFFYNLRKDNIAITVRLTSGEERMGRLRRFDNFALRPRGRRPRGNDLQARDRVHPLGEPSVQSMTAAAARSAPRSAAASRPSAFDRHTAICDTDSPARDGAPISRSRTACASAATLAATAAILACVLAGDAPARRGRWRAGTGFLSIRARSSPGPFPPASIAAGPRFRRGCGRRRARVRCGARSGAAGGGGDRPDRSGGAPRTFRAGSRCLPRRARIGRGDAAASRRLRRG